MASYAEEDVQELERLVGDAKRPAVKSLLEEQLAIVKRKVAAVAAQQQVCGGVQRKELEEKAWV